MVSGPGPTSPSKLRPSHLLWLMAPASCVVSLSCSLRNKDTGKEKMGRCHEGHKGPRAERGKGMESMRAPSPSPVPWQDGGKGWGKDQDLPSTGSWREESSAMFWSYLGEGKIFIANWDKRSEPRHFSVEILPYFVS